MSCRPLWSTRFGLGFAVVMLTLTLSPMAQSGEFQFAVATYDPLTNISGLSRISTNGIDVELISRFAYSEADAMKYHTSPSYSPDGSELLFIAQPSNRPAQIYVQTVEDGITLPLTDSPQVSYYQAAWSPDGTKIAYSAARVGKFEDIFVMNADGSSITQITSTPEYSEVWVSWSPDGNSLAYVQRDIQLNYQIMIVPSEGGEAEPIGESGVVGTTPKWSHDGTQLYYATRDKETLTATINSTSLDGTTIRTLYSVTGTDPVAPGIDSIDISPDGNTMAFIQADFTSLEDRLDITNSLNLLDLQTGEVLSPEWITDGLWFGPIEFEPASTS